jgi:phage shock protein PspC (stress-responsive transcriptional regulator)
MPKKIKKSINDKMLAGVCGGLAEYLGWDSTIIRVLFVVCALIGVGSPILIYLILAIVFPE